MDLGLWTWLVDLGLWTQACGPRLVDLGPAYYFSRPPGFLRITLAGLPLLRMTSAGFPASCVLLWPTPAYYFSPASRTPAYFFRTPAYYFRTPAYYFRTPAYYFRTPAYYFGDPRFLRITFVGLPNSCVLL